MPPRASGTIARRSISDSSAGPKPIIGSFFQFGSSAFAARPSADTRAAVLSVVVQTERSLPSKWLIGAETRGSAPRAALSTLPRRDATAFRPAPAQPTAGASRPPGRAPASLVTRPTVSQGTAFASRGETRCVSLSALTGREHNFKKPPPPSPPLHGTAHPSPPPPIRG